MISMLISASASTLTNIPEFYGIYALSNGNLTELTNHWKTKPELNNDVKFIFFDKAVSRKMELLKIFKLIYIRNHIYTATKDIEKKRTYTVIKNKDRMVEIRFKPVKGEPEMLYIVPKNSLESGIYVLTWGNFEGYFVIDRKGLKKLRNGKDCFDKVYNNAFSQAMEAGAIRSCKDSKRRHENMEKKSSSPTKVPQKTSGTATYSIRPPWEWFSK